MKIRNAPKCKRSDCFSNVNGRCKLLSGKIKKCTFYKSHEQVKLDKVRHEDWYTKWIKQIEKRDKEIKRKVE